VPVVARARAGSAADRRAGPQTADRELCAKLEVHLP